MKRYELWADGKLIKDYTRKGDALNAWAKNLAKFNRVFVLDVKSNYDVIVSTAI